MKLGGIPLFYDLRYDSTIRWFKWYMEPSSEGAGEPIRLEDSLYLERKKTFNPCTAESFIEYRILVEPTGRKLSEKGLFIFHAVAFAWKGYAWLLTAPSGTGKTTHYLNWKRMWPDETQIICGDMPVLKQDGNGRIVVFPSPWNGKERMGFENNKSYPLGGIVYLVQSDQNVIERADFRKMILPLWNQFIGIPYKEEQIRSMERFANTLFGKYPVWNLENRGDTSSTQLIRKTFEKSLETHQSKYNDQPLI